MASATPDLQFPSQPKLVLIRLPTRSRELEPATLKFIDYNVAMTFILIIIIIITHGGVAG